MKCFNCGKETNSFVCEECRSEEVLDRVFWDIMQYKPETSQNAYLSEYAESLTNDYNKQDIIPQFLPLFDEELQEFYWCRYYRYVKDERLEEADVNYLKTHAFEDVKSQRIVYDLLSFYIPNEFIKPQKWCKKIVDREGLCSELYVLAADFYSKIGEYDLADELLDRAVSAIESGIAVYLYSNAEAVMKNVDKQRGLVKRYREGRPYWPATEERRRAVAMFYDEKGISYGRAPRKENKIKECDFAPIHECFEEDFTDYSAFWCSDVFSIGAKCIYQIAAVKVREGRIVDEFQSFICPWDGRAKREAAAQKAGVDLDVIELSEDVKTVMEKFFEFVGDDILVSTDALGDQIKIMSRAARYAMIPEIKNELYDLLDLASDADEQFDMENNNRKYLIEYFGLSEGVDSLEKARINVDIYTKLMEYGR